MKQKLLLLAAVLCSAFSAHAVNWQGEQIVSGKEYYLYNPNANVFLNANGSVGTSPEILWKVTVTGSNCQITSGNYCISILLEKNLLSNGLSSQNAYSGTRPSDADNNLKYIQKGNGYQFYYTKSWKPAIYTYYATGFLTASTSGIGCYGIWHGRTNPSTPSYDGNEALWYLISPEQYNSAEEYYYYQVKTSANLGAKTYLSTTSDATSGESTVSDIKSPTKPNNKATMYAFVERPNDFSQFLGWKTSEDATEYVSYDNPYRIEVEYSEGVPEDGPTFTLYAEFTQIYTDSPETGDYVLFNPEHGFYMQSTTNGNTVTTNPNLATLYYVDSYEGGLLGNNEYTTLQFDNNNNTYYVGQNEGDSSNSTERFGWIVQTRNDGYTLFAYENLGTTQRYISAYDEEANGSGIAFRRRADVELPFELNNDRWPESTWMFFSKEHWKSVSANNSAVLAVKATLGYGTFVAPFDVTLPAGITAFTVTGFEGTKLTLNKVADPQETLAANTAVVLESTNGTDIVETVVAQGEAYGERNANSGNYLVGTYERTAVPEGSYLLQYQNNHAAFFLVDGTNGKLYSGKNRAYLTNVPQESGVKAFSLNGSETAIDEIIVVNEDTAIYDMSGRRLSKKPARGLYIQNGKKILVK